MPLPEISKIVVPALDGTPGGIYALKDTYARQLLSGGIEFRIVWDGNSTPVVANIPDVVSIRYEGNVYTGTLPASSGQHMVFYLVKNNNGGDDNFAEYVVATDANNNIYWEKIGETGQGMSNFGALAYLDSIELSKGNGVNVIGENATLQAQNSSVSFAAHTTDKVLGEATTFTFTDPTYSATLTKGNITLTRSTDAAINAQTGSALTGLSASTHKTTVLKSDTAFTRKKIKTSSIRGVTGSNTTASVTVNPTMQKLKTTTITPATTYSLSGSSLITDNYKKLETTSITGVSGSTSASSITNVGDGNLVVATFKKVNQINANNAQNNEWKDTTANLDFHMYASGTDGTTGVFADADNETLVISFKTMPSLKLASSDTTYATGAIDERGTGDRVLNGITYGSVTVPVAASAKTVATGSLKDTTVTSNVGGTVMTGTTSSSVNVASVGSSVRVATGSITGNSTEFSDETNGGQVTVGITSATVSVPAIASSAIDVLIPETTTATTSTSDVNVLTEVTTTGHTVDVYDTIAFDSRSDLLKDTTTLTQPVFTASITANSNGAVITDVTAISKATSGSISVGTNDKVDAITALGTATAAAQNVSFSNKDLKKVALYDDLGIVAQSNPVKRFLNFLMPSGGTVTLKKNGTPTANTFEYSLDGYNWETWTMDSQNNKWTMNLAENERLFVRNASATNKAFSTSITNYYSFEFDNPVYAYGSVMSLLCKNPEAASLSSYCFAYLFKSRSQVKTAPDYPATVLASYCYYGAHYENHSLRMTPELVAQTTSEHCYEMMFYNCSGLNTVRTRMTGIATGATTNWLDGVPQGGTFYCPAALSITTNSFSGIPGDWTRVDW